MPWLEERRPEVLGLPARAKLPCPTSTTNKPSNDEPAWTMNVSPPTTVSTDTGFSLVILWVTEELQAFEQRGRMQR